MARKLRLEYAGACYHVINRGNYRQDLFTGKGAAESFLACVGEAAERFGWRMHAYVVMRNHFHLAVETPEPNLSEGMKWLQGTWAVRFNRFRGEMGRPFQGRYKALHLEPGHALAQVAHYIHLNPVRAKVVSADRVLEYRWSSLPRFMGKDRPPWLEGRTVLRESGGLPDTAGGWRRYVGYLGVLAEEDQQRREERYGRLSRGWMIGSAEFRDGLQQQLVKQMKTLERVEWAGANTGANRQIREQLWEQRLQRLAKLLAIDLKQLPPRRSAAAKVELAAAMKATTSVSNGWLAERLQMGLPASVSQYIRRFRLAGSTEAHRFRTALSRINT